MSRYPCSFLPVLLIALAASPGLAQHKPVPTSLSAQQAAKDAELARIRIIDSSAELTAIAQTEPEGSKDGGEGAQPAGAELLAGSIGNRRGDLDRFFGDTGAGFPGRTTAPFDLAGDPDDRAFGVLVEVDDGVVSIGRAGSIANGTRIAISRHLANGQLDPGFATSGRQTLDVLWTGDTQLTFSKAAGVVGTVGPVFLNRFYVLGQLDLTSSDSDFVVLCLRRSGSTFATCPDFGTLGNGMVRVAFDLGGGGLHKDIPRAVFIDQINQKLLLAGAAQRNGGPTPGSDYDFAIARMDLFTGAPDTGFGFSSSGKQVVAFDLAGSSLYDEALAVHVRPFDNKIVVAGFANVGLIVFRSAMAQLNADGSLDTAFCAPSVTSCASPASHRSGRRLWIDDGSLGFAQVVHLDGGGLAPLDTIVVREQVVSADNGRARIERVADDGGCTICTSAWFQGFERIRPITALLDFRFVPPFLFDFGVVVAGYGIYSKTDDQNTHIARVRSDMTLDDAFSSGLSATQQFYDFPVAPGEPLVSRPAAMSRDSKGRYLIAGARRWRATGNDWDFALARLQNDVIFAHGLE